jgi:outer membrane protein OmpA-like peptidoglycan-associated protein
MPSPGKAVSTQTLTQQRADEIKKQLVSYGAEAASIDAKGWGDTKPVINNETEKNRIANYRVEISGFQQ